MSKLYTIAVLMIILPSIVTAQNSLKAKDIAAIKSMAGCYDVEFKYTETFAPEVDYEKAYDYTSAAFEWAEIIEETDNKISLQHLLIINDSMIIKHWRQDWIYESPEQMAFFKDREWKYTLLNKEETKNTWTQNVYQVDDSPRYSGTATWTHVDGVSSWYNKADSPLPRREYTKRSDYNVMKRGNRVQILEDGWLHEQDNDKVIRTDESDVILVQEKGYNTYKKRPTTDCISAQKYWDENKEMWSGVRKVWDGIFENKKDIKLNDKVEGKRLYEQLFYPTTELEDEEIESIIQSYLITQ